jgi:Ca2+-binding EF-hand superfamily protein
MYRLHFTAGALVLLAAVVALGQDGVRPKGKKKLDPAQMLKRFDANGDGVLERAELPEAMKERFAQMDANKDGKLDREELAKMAQRFGAPAPPEGAGGDMLFRLLDADGDGKLSKEELQNAAKALERFDRDKDGMLNREELLAPKKKFPGRPGEIITPAAKGERIADKLNVGDPAPAFTLPLVNGKGAVALAAFQDKKPVVLIFASYT